jgi:hypothetical protein
VDLHLMEVLEDLHRLEALVDHPTVDLALPLHLVDQADYHPHWTLEGRTYYNTLFYLCATHLMD